MELAKPPACLASRPQPCGFGRKNFSICNPKKAESGARKYSVKDMEKLSQIHHLVKERGFTLDGARQKLRSGTEEVVNYDDVVRRLHKVKSELDQFVQTIKTLP